MRAPRSAGRRLRSSLRTIRSSISSGSSSPASSRNDAGALEGSGAMTRAGLLIAALILSFGAMVFAHRDPLHVLFRIGDEEGALADLAALGRPELATAELHYEDGTRGRIYRPASGPIRGKQLVFHGMHRLGIDEPRLIILARAIAELGFEVHTPELEGRKN